MSDNISTIEDLVLNDYFRKWVQGRLPAEDTYWETWLAEVPERAEMVIQAKYIIEAFRMEHEVLSERRLKENVGKIMTGVEKENGRERYPFVSLAWKVAAMIALTAAMFWYFARENEHTPYDTMVEAKGMKTIEKINNAGTPLIVSLSDGSSITLQPGSKLSYPEEFDRDKREVILSGEGFFDVARDPERPFRVYAGEIVTKVLGTSFHVRAYEKDADITVKVVTGKVSVLTSKLTKERRGAGEPADGLILTPNQMAVYARSPEKLTRTLVENPGIIKSSAKKSSDYNFEDTPVPLVFRALEEGYGVTIVYNTEQLAGCTVTAPLENENLYEKLDMICKVIRAGYEIVDAQVVITSKGCL